MRPANFSKQLKHFLARKNNLHLPDGRPNVFLFSTPRSGSTWILELILTQPGFRPSNEPFNLRSQFVGQHLGRYGITTFADLLSDEHRDHLDEYIGGISSGRIGITNPFFYRNHFRLITRRTAFKMLHGCEDRMTHFQEKFNGRVLYLIRHPIPVSVSRKSLPRLEALLNGPLRAQLNQQQIQLATQIVSEGEDIERAVLDWCLQNVQPLRELNPEWTVITYEQMVLDPEPALQKIAARLDLPQPDLMAKRLARPSASTYLSDRATRNKLKGPREDIKNWLVEKWREKVNSEQEKRLMEIVHAFEIDIYTDGNVLPDKRFWL